MGRIICHVDLNAFFATCEELRHPEYKGKPLAVGGEGRSGIISTCNYVARKYGVHSGQPTFQAKENCPSLLVVPPDFDYYKMMSISFFALWRKISPLLEKASIDEAYIDMSNALRNKADPLGYLRRIQKACQEETGLTCSIGVAPTKWLAKMGSDYQKPNGLTLIRRKDIPALLYPLPIESFWGIGKKTSPRLREWGVNTIGDLSVELKKKNPGVLKELGSFAPVVEAWLAGKGDDEVKNQEEDAKSVSSAETLMRDIVSLEEAGDTFNALVQRISSSAKALRRVGYTVTATIKDSRFKTHQRSKTLEYPTNEASPIKATAKRLFEELFADENNLPVRLIGVGLSRLEDPVKETIQMNLWNYQDYEKMDETKLLINELNRKAKTKLFVRAREAKEK